MAGRRQNPGPTPSTWESMLPDDVARSFVLKSSIVCAQTIVSTERYGAALLGVRVARSCLPLAMTPA